MQRGYSDRINHAFAFAAVHHDGQLRKGTRIPYISHLGNVATILARYGQDEDTIVVAILHDVIEDCKLNRRKTYSQKIARKFGEATRGDVMSVTKPGVAADGRKLKPGARNDVYIENLATASDRALWVCAADKLHNSRSTISDLARAKDPEKIWSKFKKGRASVEWYRQVIAALEARGFDAPIMEELRESVEKREEVSALTG